MVLSMIMVGVLLAALAAMKFIRMRQMKKLRIPVLTVLQERGALEVGDIIDALREKELYPFGRISRFSVIRLVCQRGVKAGLMTYAGNVFINRFSISDKGIVLLDEYQWRKGNKKFSA